VLIVDLIVESPGVPMGFSWDLQDFKRSSSETATKPPYDCGHSFAPLQQLALGLD